MTNRQQVTKFAQQHGLKVNGKDGIPMLSNASLSWIECYNNWQEAFDALMSARNSFINSNKSYPWA